MNDNEVEILLADLHAKDVEKAPKQYNREESHYGKCPPIWRYRQAAGNNSWTSNERQHVRQCPYCQKSIAMQWRFECPDAAVLENTGFADAVRIHMERDGCGRCKALSKLIHAPLTGWIAGMLALAGGQDDRGTTPFSFQCTTGEPPMEITLREQRGDLILRVQCRDRDQAEKQVLVTLRLQDGEVLSRDMVLRDRQQFGCLEEVTLGPLKDFASRMVKFAVSAEWVAGVGDGKES